MSETLCTLRGTGGGGGRYTETSLWTNPSPSSTFAAQAVTLSDSIDNYKYIAIKYAFNTQLQTGSYISTMIAAVDDVKKWGYNVGAHHAIASIGVQNASNNIFSRGCFYISSTSIRFTTSYQAGATTYNNDTDIPLEILGLNELDHGTKTTSNVEVFPLATVTGGTQPTYTTKGRAVAIWQMWGRTDNIGFGIRTNVNPTTGAINNNEIYMSQNAGISWTIQSGASFTVTDTTITTTTISSNNRLVALAYTY